MSPGDKRDSVRKARDGTTLFPLPLSPLSVIIKFFCTTQVCVCVCVSQGGLNCNTTLTSLSVTFFFSRLQGKKEKALNKECGVLNEHPGSKDFMFSPPPLSLIVRIPLELGRLGDEFRSVLRSVPASSGI